MQFELFEEGEDTFFEGGGNDRMRAKVFSFSFLHVTGRLPSLHDCIASYRCCCRTPMQAMEEEEEERQMYTQFLCGGHILARVLLAGL